MIFLFLSIFSRDMPCQLRIQEYERDQAKASVSHFWSVLFLEESKKLSVLRLWYGTKIFLEDFLSWKLRKKELMSKLKCKRKQHNLKWGLQHMTKKKSTWYWLHYYSSAPARIRSRKQSKFYHLLVLCSAQFIKLTPTHKVLGLRESSPYFRS